MISNCEACNLAKARAKKTPAKTDHPATSPFERIHCDAVMIKHHTEDRKQGFSMIVDEFTKFIDVKLITRKNDNNDNNNDDNNNNDNNNDDNNDNIDDNNRLPRSM